MKNTAIRPMKGKERPAGRVMTFLNSAFCLWFLSTIVVGLLSWGYTQWDAARTERQQNGARLDKLSLESWARIQDLKIHSRGDMTAILFGLHANPNNLAAVSSGANRVVMCFHLVAAPDRGGSRGVFPEFKDRDLVSLLRELLYYLPSSETADVKQTLEIVLPFDGTDRLYSNAPPTMKKAAEVIGRANIFCNCVDQMAARHRWDDPDHPYKTTSIPFNTNGKMLWPTSSPVIGDAPTTQE